MITKTRPTLARKTISGYALLGRIRRLILEEPRRYNQRSTLAVVMEGHPYPPDIIPPCGTIGCVGGWIVALTRPSQISSHTDVVALTQEILQLDIYSTHVLTDFHAAGWRGFTMEEIVPHAERGAEHIAQFMKDHKAHLQAVQIVVER